MGPWPTTCRPSPRPSPSPSYDPAAEVVELCRDLIRIDTSNYGDDDGPGERKAAEYVAALLDEVGISSNLYESEPGRTSLVARWGGRPGRAAAAARPPRRRARRRRGLAGRPVRRRDPRRLRLGPRCGRHEGLRRDGCSRWSAPGPGPARPRTGRSCSASPPTRRPAATRAPSYIVEQHADEIADCTEAVGEVGGFTTTVRGKRIYLIEAAEKGMAWMKLTARGRAGHGSMINHDNAVTELAGAVARIGAHQWPVRLTPAMEVLLASVADLAGTEATPENAEALVEEFGELGPDARRGDPQHRQPDDARAPATR